jgi:8-oxo-dGTP pyrophosphatase MutT (NUDIX family)
MTSMDAVTSSLDTSVILAAGGILCRKARQGEEILVVHRKRYDDWTLPKGKLKPGEAFITAALREVEEETGCVARVEKYLGAIGYEANGIPKAVLFWRMSVVEQKEIADHGEVREALWIPVAVAAERLTYADERAFALRTCGGERNV